MPVVPVARNGHDVVPSLFVASIMILISFTPLVNASTQSHPVTNGIMLELSFQGADSLLQDGDRAPPITYTKPTNYEQLVNWYKALEQQYPAYLRVWKANEDYGHGQIANRSGPSGYDYWMVRLTNESLGFHKPEVLFIGNPHGDETAGPVGQYWFCSWILRNARTDDWNTTEDDWLNWLLDNREIYLVVSHNPDGFNNMGSMMGRYDALSHDLNRQADWDFVPNSPVYDTGPVPWGEPNGKTLRDFIQEHQIRTGADIHGGIRAMLYPWSSSHSGASDVSKKSSNTISYVPPDFHFFDIGSLRLGAFIGNYDGALDKDNTGPVYPTIGYEAPGGIMSWAYGGDVANYTVEDPHVLDETYGNYAGAGIMWHSPEISSTKNVDGSTFGGDNQAGYGPDVRRLILHQADLAQPYIFIPKSYDRNNTIVNVGDDIVLTWKVNGCLVVDNTYIQWGTNSDPVNSYSNTTPQRTQFKDKYWGGTGWENADSGNHLGYSWTETVKAPNQIGDYYFVIKAQVDQVFANTSNPTIYGDTPYLDIVRERTDPTYSNNLPNGADGQETMTGQIWWYSKVIHIKVVKRPEVLDFFPKDKAAWVPTDSNISVTFDLAMDKSATESAFKISPPTTGSFVWNGSQIIFDPAGELAPETTYKIGINSSAKSLLNTDMGADLNFSFKTAFSTDISLPSIISTYPLDKSTNVSVHTMVYINFSENMNATVTAGAFSLFPVTKGNISWANGTSTLVFTPADKFQGPVDYTYSISTAAMDLSKNKLAKFQSFKFRTELPDDTPPKWTQFSPANNSKDVNLTWNISIEFSEKVIWVPYKSINISPYLAGTFTDWLSTGVVFNPDSEMPAQTTFTVTATTDIRDLAGNHMVSPLIFSFTTKDITPPFVVSTDPVNGATNVSVDTMINVEFSEPMDIEATAKAIVFEPAIKVVIDKAGSNITIGPSDFFAYSTLYNITFFNTSKDINGVRMAQHYKFSFTTISPPDTTPPRVVATDPFNKKENVSGASQLIITFNEPVLQPARGKAISFSPEPTTPWTFTVNGPTVTVIPTTAGKWLEENTQYTVMVSGGFSDLALNTMDKDHYFQFTTGYSTSPEIRSVLPVNGAVKVPTETAISVEFSRTMNWTSAQIAFSITPDTPGSFSHADNNLTFKPMNALKAATIYTIKVTSTAKDTKGNMLAQEFQSSFTTKKATPKTNALGGGSMLLPLLILIIIIVAIIVVAILVTRSRKQNGKGDWDTTKAAVAPAPAPIAEPVPEAPPPAPQTTTMGETAASQPGPAPIPAEPAPAPATGQSATLPAGAGGELDDIIKQLSDGPK